MRIKIESIVFTSLTVIVTQSNVKKKKKKNGQVKWQVGKNVGIKKKKNIAKSTKMYTIFCTNLDKVSGVTNFTSALSVQV